MSKPRLRTIPNRIQPAPDRLKVASARGQSVRTASGGAWRTLRLAALRRDHGMCQVCKRFGFARVATEVDHIVSVERGGADRLANLQSICAPHHREKTAQEIAGLEWQPSPSPPKASRH